MIRQYGFGGGSVDVAVTVAVVTTGCGRACVLAGRGGAGAWDEAASGAMEALAEGSTVALGAEDGARDVEATGALGE